MCAQLVVGMEEVSVLCMHASILAKKCRDRTSVRVTMCHSWCADKDWGGATGGQAIVEKVERARAVCGEGKSECASNTW